MYRLALLFVLVACACSAQNTESALPVYKLLYTPPSGVAGANPQTIFEVSPGVFYFLSVVESDLNGASIARVTSNGTFEVLYSLPPFTNSFAIVQGTNSELYLPAYLAGNNGKPNQNYYEALTPAAQVLGQYPLPGNQGVGVETIPAPGRLYDMLVATSKTFVRTYSLAAIENSGALKILHTFSGGDGIPIGNYLIYGSDGSIYGFGTQQTGGVYPGWVFRITPQGQFSKLATFPQFGWNNQLPLIQASDGNLYGLFGAGGTNNTGQLYRVTLSGQTDILANFPAKHMVQPWTLMQASDGNIYGTTQDNFIFRYNFATQKLEPVYHLSSSGSQGQCGCDLIQGMDGKIYGATPVGGNFPGLGAVFSLDIGLAKPLPAIQKFEPASAKPGGEVLLWGKYLLGATSVTFNGTPSTSVKVSSGQSVWATVPAGATNGPITVTTANGSYTTAQSFIVQ